MENANTTVKREQSTPNQSAATNTAVSTASTSATPGAGADGKPATTATPAGTPTVSGAAVNASPSDATPAKGFKAQRDADHAEFEREFKGGLHLDPDAGPAERAVIAADEAAK